MRVKLLLASDLHYVPNLADEIASNQHRLPAGTYNHQVDGKLFWHNQMMVEQGERLLDGLERITRQERPDLLIFLGDMVNINWEKSVAGVAARFAHFPCPVRQVTGNHDIYLQGAENSLQDALAPGTAATGLRHEKVEGLGLLYLDLFSCGEQDEYRKWGDPHARERVEYRPQDLEEALALVEGEPQTPWLIFGHFPFVSPEPRLDGAGRKIGWLWPNTAPLAARLHARDNLLGMVCGHQHFAHLQRLGNSVHWTLPALVEYPCAAAILEWDGASLSGRTVAVDATLAAESLATRQQHWTEGEAIDQAFHFSLARTVRE
jgi:hypothetical protein